LGVPLDLLLIEGLDDITLLEAGLGRRAAAADVDQLDAGVGLVAAQAGPGDARRPAHADLLAVDDDEDLFRVLAVPVDADAAQGPGGQALLQRGEGLAAVARLVEAAAGAPLLDGVVAVVALGRRLLGAGVAVETVALPFPGGDDQFLGVGRVHAH